METDIIFKHSRRLHPIAQIELAQQYRTLATRLENEAKSRMKHMNEIEDWDYSLDTLHGVPDAIRKLKHSGLDEEQAIKKLASLRHTSTKCIRGLMNQHKKKERRANIERRNMIIIQMARKGMNYTEIGKKIGIHRSQVSRIVDRHLYRYE